MSDPICAHCGSPLSKHYHEDEIYCFENTNGDTFSDEPDAETIGQWIENSQLALSLRK